MLEGKYWDQLKRADGRFVDYGWRSNVIVDQCRQLIAAFMKGDTVNGIQYIALGTGDELWDAESPSSPDSSTESLVDLSPIQINTGADMQVEFINAVGDVTANVEDSLEITVEINSSNLSLSEGEVYPLREFALFGQRDGSDFMIDYVRHPVVNIAYEDTLTRRVRLIF